MINKICLICGKKFLVKNYRKNSAKFCSCQCSGKYYYEQKKNGLLKDKRGKKHWNWKSGRKVNSQGYVLIYSPQHPYKNKQNCVRQHRLVMEKFLKRYLLPNEVVHHRNNIRNDNRIGNLMLLDKRTHDKLTNKERPRKEKIDKICPICEKNFQVLPSLKRIVCCSRSCSTLFRWKNGKSVFGR